MSGLFRCFAVAVACLRLTDVAMSQSVSTPASDDGRVWLDARNAATSSLAAASRATALNQNEAAETLLHELIRDSPQSREAADAHKLLSRIYVRTGRYQHASDNLDDWRRDFPDNADARAEVKDFEPFRGLPDQVNGRRRRAILKHEGDFAVPLSINGKACAFLMDTGADVSLVTRQSAQRLGLEFLGAGGRIGDASGKGVTAQTAVARELVIGNMRLQNVTFIVVPDDAPFTSVPLSHRGILGVPIQLAVGTWQWTKPGIGRSGTTVAAAGERRPNLVFFRNKTLVAAEIEGRLVFLTLDSGAVDTDLNSGFVERFGSLLANVPKTTREITGVGGTSSFDGYLLPELRVSVAGRLLTLHPAAVTVQRVTGGGGDCCVGNFGNDLLTQTGRFTLDFDNMSLGFR